MDEGNLKMKPLLVSAPDSKLLLEAIKNNDEEISLLLARMADIKKNKEEIADIEKKLRFMSFLAVLGANLWALISACFLGGLSAYNIFLPPSHQQCSESKTCYELTCAAAHEIGAILYGLLCCSVLQAAAAVPALLLTGRRRRCRALSYAALAATTVSHCMYGRIQWLLLAAYPGDWGIIVCVCFSAIADLLLFFLLIQGGRDDGDGGKQA